MKELVVARQALIKDRTAALNRQKIVRSPLLQRQLLWTCIEKVESSV
jgi:transposase